MSPKVSVVIPAYRCVGTLEDSVRSVLDQTFSDLEVIIVDDASGDGSAEVAERIAAKDLRITVIRHNKNTGVAGARNSGVRAAKADWIAFLDSDDLWEPSKLARQLEIAAQTNAALIYTAAICIDGNGEPTGKMFSVPETVAADKLLRGNDLITSTTLVKRAVYQKHPMERSDLHEDLICWYRILKDGEKAVGINEPLVRYRVSEGSKSGNKRRSAVMTYRTYRFLGVGFFKRIACFIGYFMHGVKRYWL